MVLPIIIVAFSLASVSLAGESVSASATPVCPAVDGRWPVYIPHEDCSKFYECSNGTPHLFDCPAPLEFNPNLNVCDWPERAGCTTGDEGGESDSSSSSSSSEEDSSSSSESEGDDDSEEGDDNNEENDDKEGDDSADETVRNNVKLEVH